jgi:hypothetical protein
MDELIATIYEITVAMDRSVREENYEEFEKLLNDRNTMMMRVDTLLADNPRYQYTENAKKMLEDTRLFDQNLIPLVKESQAKTRTFLNQIKKNQHVSKNYQPYIKQTNGVFIDAKK